MAKDSCVKKFEVVFIPADKLTKALKDLCKDALSKEALESKKNVVSVDNCNRHVGILGETGSGYIMGFQIHFVIDDNE